MNTREEKLKMIKRESMDKLVQIEILHEEKRCCYCRYLSVKVRGC